MESQEHPETDQPTDDPLDVELYPWQWDAVYNCDQYKFLALIGGRGSGKSHIDAPRIVRWSEMSTDLPWGIFAATNKLLHTVLAPIRRAVDAMGIKHTYGRHPPEEWARRWDDEGIPYPPPRFDENQFWIWEEGTHIFTGSIINGAHTRAKSISMNGILLQEGTEPGVTEDAVDSLFMCLRCGRATLQPDGSRRCVVPGHIHQFVLVGNVPLNDPAHFIYKKIRKYKAQELQRKAEKKAPFFHIIRSRTQDNLATGDSYLEVLGAALDPATFEQQTSGSLEPNRSSLTYYAYDESANVIAGPDYNPRRALHMYMDFNRTPAAVGWGHDLAEEEVPEAYRRPGLDLEYFHVNGELFSDNDPMPIEQVAMALIEDPTRKSRCRDCGCEMREHVQMAAWMCQRCGYRTCSGVPIDNELSKHHIRVAKGSAWRGLYRHVGPIYFYGDATGRAGSAAGPPIDGGLIGIFRQTIEANFSAARMEHIHFRFKKANPPEFARVLAMNSGLLLANGARRLFVAPHCTAHLDDFREIVPDPKDPGKMLKKTKSQCRAGDEYWKRTHMTDGLGYMWDFRWPARVPKAGMPLMGDPNAFEPMDSRFVPPR